MCGQLSPLTRDFHRLLKNVKKLTNNQVEVLNFNDDVTEFDLEIKPCDGYYKRGKFKFNVKTTNYPTQAPKVMCETNIYHPNISWEDNGDVCLSLFDEWTGSNDLEDCIQGLLFLLYNPNLNDPLNPYFDPEDENQHTTFEEDVKRSLEGGEIEGIYYERNIVEDEINEDTKDTPESGINSSREAGEADESHTTLELIPKGEDTTIGQSTDIAIVKDSELSEKDIVTGKNDTNVIGHDKTWLQNVHSQPEIEETKIS